MNFMTCFRNWACLAAIVSVFACSPGVAQQASGERKAEKAAKVVKGTIELSVPGGKTKVSGKFAAKVED